MSRARRVESEQAAEELARHLLDARRRRPVVVVSVGADRYDDPWIQADVVAEAVGDLAEVNMLHTGPVSWAFSAAMPPLAQVYGDAARVYPVDQSWAQNPRLSRLHLCHGASRGPSIEEQLISEAMTAALSAGLLERSVRSSQKVTGRVLGIAAGRGIVTGDFGQAVIRGELGGIDVPIDHLVTPGQVVTGLLDTERFLDVRGEMRDHAEALAHVGPGDVLLTRAATVGRTVAVLEPFPGLRVEVDVTGVTGNPHDDLRDLMTPGEVIPARVIRAGRWVLSLLDVDDDEEITESPSLLPGGPPWLVEPVDVPASSESLEPEPGPPPAPDHAAEPIPASGLPSPRPPTAPPPTAAVPTGLDRPVERSATIDDVDASTPRRGPSPLDLDPRRRRGPAPPPVENPAQASAAEPAARRSSRDSARALSVEREARAIAQRTAESLRRELEQLNAQLDRTERENAGLQDQLNRKRTETRELKKQLRRARPVADETQSSDHFLDREQGFRHEVYLAWVDTIPAVEKSAHPLSSSWSVGPDFLDSLDEVEGVSRAKVLEVVVQVLTGLAASMPGRQTHRLRTGPGGDDPYVSGRDGWQCWRVSLQTNTPAARRLHYWTRGNETILSRIVLHDDFRP